MGTTTKMKAIELVFDWNLWPRHESGELDQTNLKKIKQAIVAGIKLPPVVINQKDNRIIDGFHRTKAMLSLYGDGVEIDVKVINFKTDAEMFMESARLNNEHGLPLSPRDRVHVYLKARKYKIPNPGIASILGVEVDELKEFIEKRTAKTKQGEIVSLSGGSLNLAGKILTTKQEDYIKHTPGISAQLYARLLLNALEANAIIFSDKVVQTLRELNVKIEKILAEVK
jgi:hypothetical protein